MFDVFISTAAGFVLERLEWCSDSGGVASRFYGLE